MHSQTINTEEEKTMLFAIDKLCKNSILPSDVIHKAKLKLKKFPLYPLEVCQLLDIWPKNLLDLQLIIEEMEERFEMSELYTILNVFK